MGEISSIRAGVRPARFFDGVRSGHPLMFCTGMYRNVPDDVCTGTSLVGHHEWRITAYENGKLLLLVYQ